MSKKYKWLTKDLLLKDYAELQSFKLIAEKYNIWPSSIIYYCKKFNIKTIPKLSYTCNDNFFNNETEESFYIAGFIAADGCILQNKSKEPNNINITLSIKDENHLITLKNLLQFTGPVKYTISKHFLMNEKWKDIINARFSIYSKKMIFDLKKFGIGPRKSLTYEFPQNIIEHPLINHFMRGYFDGDGSFYINNKTKNERLIFSLRGTIKFLETYQLILNKTCNLKSITIPKMNCNIGQLTFKGQDDVKNIIKFIYKDANIYLNRKYDLSHRFI